ncbi:MAG: 4'-phosphopantetheinyl transferase superfamily protein [Spirochaetaceae bacterium]|jgi:hypothetical protein|nr:4'-phosphopantetheinyl transferase superfamily protein [Spirochaetaceae bacterium]
MMDIFYLGLSYVSNQDPGNPGQHSRRILGKLDRRAEKDGVLARGLAGEGGTSGEGRLILTEAGGRPYFADCHADFSISHSKKAAAVSYLASPSPGRLFRTGCDIQYHQPQKAYREIAAHFFHPPEREFLAAAGTEGLRAFYLLWVLKEAYLKVRGGSVFDLCRCPAFNFEEAGGRSPPEILRDRGELEGVYIFPQGYRDGRDLEFFLYETGEPAADAYSLAVCRERDERDAGPSAEPELRWFSGETLPLKSIARIKAAERPIKTVRPKI